MRPPPGDGSVASVNPVARTASPSERRTPQSPKPKIRCVTARSLSRGSSASLVNSGAPKNRVSGRCGSTSSTKPTNSYSCRNRMMSATTSALCPSGRAGDRRRSSGVASHALPSAPMTAHLNHVGLLKPPLAKDMRRTSSSNAATPRSHPGSCSQREPKRPKADDVRSANLRGVVCGALALVLI